MCVQQFLFLNIFNVWLDYFYVPFFAIFNLNLLRLPSLQHSPITIADGKTQTHLRLMAITEWTIVDMQLRVETAPTSFLNVFSLADIKNSLPHHAEEKAMPELRLA